MTKSLTNNSYKLVLLTFGVLLCIASMYTHQIDDYVWYRALRGIVSFSALGVLLYYQGKDIHPILACFLLFYGTSSVVTIWYENATMATLALIINFGAVLFLIRALFPKVSFKNMSWWLIIIFVAMVLLNAYLLYEFVAMIKSMAGSSTHYLFMMLGAMSMVVIGFLALLYNFQYSSKSSLIFVSFIFLIIFSEIFRAIAYYDFAYGDIAVYVARILLIIGTLLLVHYAFLEKDKHEELPRKLL